MERMEKNSNEEGKSGLKDFYRRKSHELGDRAEQRLNAMPVASRKKWFLLVFGCMVVMLLINTLMAFRKDATPRPSFSDMVRDSIIDWSQVDVNDLSVLNLDSLAACQNDSLLENPYFK